MSSPAPLLTKSSLDAWVVRQRSQGFEIAFTNGVFDMFHVGHNHVLNQARVELQDSKSKLIVGLNSSGSVKRIKNKTPVFDEYQRASILRSHRCVDAVVIFSEDTPYNLIKRIVPTYLIKGGDYNNLEIVGKEVVEGAGGRVVIVLELNDELARTTKLVNHLQRGNK